MRKLVAPGCDTAAVLDPVEAVVAGRVGAIAV